MNATDDENIRTLLEAIRRTISENSFFLQKLKSDDADLEMTEDVTESVDGSEESFEEL